jgi:hypothetical protein
MLVYRDDIIRGVITPRQSSISGCNSNFVYDLVVSVKSPRHKYPRHVRSVILGGLDIFLAVTRFYKTEVSLYLNNIFYCS